MCCVLRLYLSNFFNLFLFSRRYHDFVIRCSSFSHFIIFRWFVVSEVIVWRYLQCVCYCCCSTYLTHITFTNKCSTTNAKQQKQQATATNATSLTNYCGKNNSNNNSSGSNKIRENQAKLRNDWSAHKSQAAYEICSKHNEADSTGATPTQHSIGTAKPCRRHSNSSDGASDSAPRR